MGKRRHHSYDEDHIRKKIRRLEEKLLKMDSENRTSREASTNPSPPQESPPRESGPQESPQLESPPREPPLREIPSPDRETITEDDELPEEFLQALGDEGQAKKELGPSIRTQLVTQWSTIMAEGLKKDAREALTEKYPTPENFLAAVAPVLNPEIAASLSEISLKRDRRIVIRQNIIGHMMTGLGKALTAIFKGEINTKSLIEQINDAAKLAAEIFHQDSSSRRFFALAGTSKTVQEAVKDVKPDTFLFGKDCGEKISTAQKLIRAGAQLRAPEPTKKNKQVNWRSPLPQQRGRSGLQHRRQPQHQKKGTFQSHQRPRQQPRTPPKPKSRYHR